MIKLLILIMSSVIFAETSTTVYSDYSNKTIDKPMSFQVGASLMMGNLESKYDDGKSSEEVAENGIKLSAGLNLRLTEELLTTSSLNVSYLPQNVNDVYYSERFDSGFGSLDTATQSLDSSANRTHFTLSQKIGYKINIQGSTLVPFAEAGFGFGRYKGTNDIEVNIPGFIQTAEISSKVNYNLFELGIGAQLVMKNNFVPFVKYEVSKINLSDDITTKTTGVNITEEETTAKRDRASDDTESVTNNVLSVGIGYIF